MSKTKKTAWRDVKAILSEKDKRELLKLVGDLYSLNKDNKVFIHSRFRIGKEQLEPYKKVISDALYPDIYKNKSIRLSAGRKAISEYRKATKDTIGSIELMVHYLECGNQFTVNFGDIDEQFYSSLASMFKSILHTLIKEPSEVQEQYFSRLERVVARDAHERTSGRDGAAGKGALGLLNYCKEREGFNCKTSQTYLKSRR